MLKLRSVILQLGERDYAQITEEFQQNKAEKFSALLRLYRETDFGEDEIHKTLGINQSAFYTLKSRLFDKIQTYLLRNTQNPRVELLRNVANVPKLVHETHRDLAVAILTRLEKELMEYDMPNELTTVYNALKKLHLHSPKYYEYTQLYNRHVAYTLALDKAESLLAFFTKTLGEYYLSREPDQAKLLGKMKEEMRNICRLYQSHHLSVFQDILDISFALLVRTPEAMQEDKTVEEMLDNLFSTFDSYPKDEAYRYLRDVANFLAFEYYHSLKLHKNAGTYCEKLNANLNTFLLSTHCCFSTKFLISRLERQNLPGHGMNGEENAVLHFEPDPADLPNYINFTIYAAMNLFNSGQYAESARLLNNLLNEVSLKNFAHAEIELKLLLALACSMCNRYEQAELLIRSASRKLSEMNKGENGEQKDSEDEDDDFELYENAGTFVKMLRLQMSSGSKDVEEKLKRLRDRFLLLNEGPRRMLSYVNMDNKFIAKLAEGVKTGARK